MAPYSGPMGIQERPPPFLAQQQQHHFAAPFVVAPSAQPPYQQHHMVQGHPQQHMMAPIPMARVDTAMLQQEQEAALHRRISSLIEQLLGENDGFAKMVRVLDRYKAVPQPDAHVVNEIRNAMRAALQVARRLETECGKCMEALRAPGSVGAPKTPQHNQGAPMAVEQPGKKRKTEVKLGPAKPVKLPFVHRAPEPNDQAAACIEGADWVLTRVVSFNDITEQVVVVDEDDSRQRSYMLRRSQVVLLPRPTEPAPRFYPRGSKALALYPESTALYAVVIVDNTLQKDGDFWCRVQFEDDEDEEGNTRTQDVLASMITELPMQLLD